MKKISCLLLIFNLMLVLIGCSAKEQLKSEAQVQVSQQTSEDENKDKAEQPDKKQDINDKEASKKKNSIEEEKDQNITKENDKHTSNESTKWIENNGMTVQKQVDKKLKNFDAIKKYLLDDETFGLAYCEMQGENFNYDNYVLHHIDFTGDNELDTIIVTYTDEDDYRTVVFVTLENNDYKYYLTDLRATKDSKFSYEDGFVIEEQNGYSKLAVNFSIEDINFIKGTYGGFSNEIIESTYDLNPDMKYKVINTVNKIDGYKKYDTDYIKYFYDETGKEHLITHTRYHYDFDEENNEHKSTEEIIADNDLSKIMVDNFIVGNDDSLKTFEKVIEEAGDIKGVIDYYIENRQKFQRNARINYINHTIHYISRFTENYDCMADDETISDENIVKVSLWGDNPIPANAESIFKIVKCFYIDDGENMDYNFTLQDGYYKIICVDDSYSNKIRMLRFDKAILDGEDVGYISRQDEYVDIIFDTKENVFTKADNIVYPTILIKNLSQLNELKHKSIWKANAVIIPEKVIFLEYADEDI
ncbi:hypothetical protein [Vallitalea maricola]|uniref:Uncharacterized protein n=1 Tax=Vallitalea maricola TaxID=3074433 RepID=A0ACB5UJX0_9FIRM|nr:hypothetical protein AN2V17_24000 [Vallitalea sp. AN17-2]